MKFKVGDKVWFRDYFGYYVICKVNKDRKTYDIYLEGQEPKGFINIKEDDLMLREE